MKSRFTQALLGLLLMTPSAMLAADVGETPSQALVLKMTDATEESFFLADRPEVGFADGRLVVTSQGMSTSFDEKQVEEFYFDYRTPTAIASGKRDGMTFTYTDDFMVSVTGSRASHAALYGVDGTLLQRKSVKDGSVSFSLSGYKSGTYLLNVENEQTYKLIKK